MQSRSYSLRNTRVRQRRQLSNQVESSNSSIEVDIEDNHIESDEEIIFENNMGDTNDSRDLIAALLRSQQDM